MRAERASRVVLASTLFRALRWISYLPSPTLRMPLAMASIPGMDRRGRLMLTRGFGEVTGWLPVSRSRNSLRLPLSSSTRRSMMSVMVASPGTFAPMPKSRDLLSVTFWIAA